MYKIRLIDEGGVQTFFDVLNPQTTRIFTRRLTGRMKTVPSDVVESIRRNRVCLKGTLFTPVTQSTDTQSMNVAIRKELDLFANVVHCFNISGVPTRHENLDLVIIRENTEGEYSGLEHEVRIDVHFARAPTLSVFLAYLL